MAGIQTSIQMQDRMTATLDSITRAMSAMLTTCETTQAAVNQGADTAAWNAARQEIVQASADVALYLSLIHILSGIQVFLSGWDDIRKYCRDLRIWRADSQAVDNGTYGDS